VTLFSLLHVTWNQVQGLTRVASQLWRTLFGSSKFVFNAFKASPVLPHKTISCKFGNRQVKKKQEKEEEAYLLHYWRPWRRPNERPKRKQRSRSPTSLFLYFLNPEIYFISLAHLDFAQKNKITRIKPVDPNH